VALAVTRSIRAFSAASSSAAIFGGAALRSLARTKHGKATSPMARSRGVSSFGLSIPVSAWMAARISSRKVCMAGRLAGHGPRRAGICRPRVPGPAVRRPQAVSQLSHSSLDDSRSASTSAMRNWVSLSLSALV